MAFLSIPNVKIAGVAAAVPKQIKDIPNSPFFAPGEAEKVMNLTGIRQSRIVPPDMCCSDLCLAAAEKLICDLQWNKEDIDILIFVSLSRDYITPATANLLQDRLGLSQECIAMDIPFACSGYIYGMSVMASMMQTGMIKKGLLLVGETTSKIQSPLDKTLWPLHGDGGSATALEFCSDAPAMQFHFAGDGGKAEAIINPDGGTRHPFTADSLTMHEFEPGVTRNRMHSIIDGMGVFNFSMTAPPKSIKALVEHFDIDIDNCVDYFLIHQANRYLIEKIVKKIKANPDKVPYSLETYGNISSGTIPLTMVTQIAEQLKTKTLHLLGCGFGSGLSWGSMYFKTQNIIVPQLIEL
ncbi:MAG: ketoacyl-ACP synthase III [Bacteroidales bacterium]|nr:ketoacyl-ACP synthase III [Bacteroidales bacterium]